MIDGIGNFYTIFVSPLSYTRVHISNDPIILPQCFWYPSGKCWFIGNTFWGHKLGYINGVWLLKHLQRCPLFHSVLPLDVKLPSYSCLMQLPITLLGCLKIFFLRECCAILPGNEYSCKGVIVIPRCIGVHKDFFGYQIFRVLFDSTIHELHFIQQGVKDGVFFKLPMIFLSEPTDRRTTFVICWSSPWGNKWPALINK